MQHLDYLLLTLKTDSPVSIGASWISNLLSEEYNRQARLKEPCAAEIGSDSNRPTDCHPYVYPRLQYKVIRGVPIISAICEGCRTLWSIYQCLDGITPPNAEWKIVEKRIIEKKASFGLCEELKKYRFLTPWLSLPEENLKSFVTSDDLARQSMLAKTLEKHLKDMAHSLGCEFNDKLNITINVKPDFFFQRDIHVAGFIGTFTINFEIPDFLGIGKSVSRGFGAVKQI